ncbi:MAG: NAD(P)-binding protein [Bacteroidetes bacterium]|nr:NAD(P)-binding protein [Bacteroidota bacterium]
MKVCIIGAGSSGIVTAKTLSQSGIDFDCYEKGHLLEAFGNTIMIMVCRRLINHYTLIHQNK